VIRAWRSGAIRNAPRPRSRRAGSSRRCRPSPRSRPRCTRRSCPRNFAARIRPGRT
jgi:hypothetical protein